MKKNIVITGAKGNLGKAVVKIFLESDSNVFATVSKGNELGFMDDNPLLNVFELDVTDRLASSSFIEKIFSDMSI